MKSSHPLGTVVSRLLALGLEQVYSQPATCSRDQPPVVPVTSQRDSACLLVALLSAAPGPLSFPLASMHSALAARGGTQPLKVGPHPVPVKGRTRASLALVSGSAGRQLC